MSESAVPDATARAERRSENDATEQAIAELEEQMATLVGRVRLNLRDAALAIDPLLQPFGLKMLRMLSKSGPMHSGALADALFVDKSVISRQARALEELGFVETHPDPHDGRARIIALTPDAGKRIAAARASDKANTTNKLRQWPVEDLKQFADYIGRLNAG
ncbi:MarR family winged helix-turn-helix transcriptional regulator [Leifsonia sp. A12D58]|uniref:MarR family winged helix-turn-helix transcriptional regulator n=1 Tax=Leifsonia sp. A12D58 TaxID=3397674 RepID=UPI0039E03EE0